MSFGVWQSLCFKKITTKNILMFCNFMSGIFMWGHKITAIILSNINRFSTFMTRRFLDNFAVKSLLKIPPHLVYVATLPCETLAPENKGLTINTRFDRLWSRVCGLTFLANPVCFTSKDNWYCKVGLYLYHKVSVLASSKYRVDKKLHIKLMAIILSNLNRFSCSFWPTL